MSSRIEIKLPSQMDYLGVPDAILMEIGSDVECCRQSLEELGTSLIEACTNAMEHGNKLDADKTTEVVFDVLPGNQEFHAAGYLAVIPEPEDEVGIVQACADSLESQSATGPFGLGDVQVGGDLYKLRRHGAPSPFSIPRVVSLGLPVSHHRPNRNRSRSTRS